MIDAVCGGKRPRIVQTVRTRKLTIARVDTLIFTSLSSFRQNGHVAEVRANITESKDET
jgi:hypothetical protein